MKRKLIFNSAFTALLFLLFTETGSAQNSRTITLREAVDLTLANNKALKNDSSKIIEAATAITEAMERRLPDAGITGAGLFLPVKPTIDLKTSSNSSSNS